MRFVPIEVPAINGEYRPAVPMRRRIGRGGRIIYDRLSVVNEERVPRITDPFDDGVYEDNSVTFRSKPVPWHHLPRIEKRICLDDSERERAWLASVVRKSAGKEEESSTGEQAKNSDENSGNGQPGRVTAPAERSKVVKFHVINKRYFLKLKRSYFKRGWGLNAISFYAKT